MDRVGEGWAGHRLRSGVGELGGASPDEMARSPAAGGGLLADGHRNHLKLSIAEAGGVGGGLPVGSHQG